MEHILEEWETIKERVAAKDIVLFLDFDGTLSPIAPTPQEAVLPKKTKDILMQLSRATSCRIVIVSGRRLEDVKEKTGIKGLTYIGNHGLEMEGPDIHFASLATPKDKETIETIKGLLSDKLKEVQGVFIEDKGLTLSIHFRLAGKEEVVLVKKYFDEVCQSFLSNKEISIGCGKKVFEVKPPIVWDKGKAILWLLTKEQFTKNSDAVPICLGDDITDEDAFDALKDNGITVFVGETQASCAKYYLRDSWEVQTFLSYLLEVKKKDISS